MADDIAGLKKLVHERREFEKDSSLSSPDLSALVSARLCHDLISPMGAIGNGLELLQMSQGGGADELALINDSLATALAKLRFYRIAFGPADPSARQSMDEAAQLTDSMFHGRFSVEWRFEEPSVPKPIVRLIFLAILCMEKSLPMGGCLIVNVSSDDVEISVDGTRTVPPTDLWAHVTHGAHIDDLQSNGVQFVLLRNALLAGGRTLATSFSEAGASLRLQARSPIPA
mgnify:CR=1 FL=1